jgi:hypothetical protein
MLSTINKKDSTMYTDQTSDTRHEHLIEQLEAKVEKLSQLIGGILCRNSSDRDKADKRFVRLENEAQLDAPEWEKTAKFKALLDKHDVKSREYFVR